LRDFDVRSRYTGDSATGSVTDSVTVASTGKGKNLILGGPASKLGKLVGSCTRQAVSEALLKQEPFWGTRTVLDRLKERHLPIEKLATEVSKIEGTEVSAEKLAEILKNNPPALTSLLAAAKMDDDYKKNLLPTGFQNWAQMADTLEDYKKLQGYNATELPPFIRNVLIRIVRAA